MEQAAELSTQDRWRSPGVEVSWHELFETNPDLEAIDIGSCKKISVILLFSQGLVGGRSVSSLAIFISAIFTLSLNVLAAQGILFKNDESPGVPPGPAQASDVMDTHFKLQNQS